MTNNATVTAPVRKADATLGTPDPCSDTPPMLMTATKTALTATKTVPRHTSTAFKTGNRQGKRKITMPHENSNVACMASTLTSE